MATQYHIFLGELSTKYSNVISKIGTDTTNDNDYVIEVVKMFTTWAKVMQKNKHKIDNIPEQQYNNVVLFMSDVYWVHRALQQGLLQHGIADESINSIISLCDLVIKHVDLLPIKDNMFQVASFIEERYVNTLKYLIDLSVDWCLNKKLPLIDNPNTPVINERSPSVNEIYDSVSYYCG